MVGGRVDYLKHGTQIWTHKPARISPVDRKEPICLRSGRILRAALVHSLLRGHAFAMSDGIWSILNEKEVMPGLRVARCTPPPFVHCLYFIYAWRLYAYTLVKTTRHWKSNPPSWPSCETEFEELTEVRWAIVMTNQRHRVSNKPGFRIQTECIDSV